MELEIIHQDDDMLVVNKPAGLATNPGGWEQGGPSLQEQLGQVHGRVWLVHRLDRGTSGVVVFARNAEAHRSISMLFETRQVRKVYHAILCRQPDWEQHTARHPLRANAGHNHRTVVDASAGKPAETHFHVLERLGTACLIEALPATGRTHQVRAHSQALGIPLLGDVLYGGGVGTLISRPALHAYSIEFELVGQPRLFHAAYPQDFASALEKLRAG